MGEDFKLLTSGNDGASAANERKLPRRYAAIAGLLGLAAVTVYGAGSGIGSIKDHFFSGDDRAPMTTSFTFPRCDGHKAIAPIEAKLPLGSTFDAGPAGSNKKLHVTVGQDGQLSFAPVTGIVERPHTPGQDEKTRNFEFDSAGTEHVSILATPDSSSDPTLRGRAVVLIEQLCS